MPTILRFRGFNIMIYTEDHEPAHVHARGKGKELILVLNCGGSNVEVRSRFGISHGEEVMLVEFVDENRVILCEAWERFHGNATQA